MLFCIHNKLSLLQLEVVLFSFLPYQPIVDASAVGAAASVGTADAATVVDAAAVVSTAAATAAFYPFFLTVALQNEEYN